MRGLVQRNQSCPFLGSVKAAISAAALGIVSRPQALAHDEFSPRQIGGDLLVLAVRALHELALRKDAG
jgi:hypothetical protein